MRYASCARRQVHSGSKTDLARREASRSRSNAVQHELCVSDLLNRVRACGRVLSAVASEKPLLECDAERSQSEAIEPGSRIASRLLALCTWLSTSHPPITSHNCLRRPDTRQRTCHRAHRCSRLQAVSFILSVTDMPQTPLRCSQDASTSTVSPVAACRSPPPQPRDSKPHTRKFPGIVRLAKRGSAERVLHLLGSQSRCRCPHSPTAPRHTLLTLPTTSPYLPRADHLVRVAESGSLLQLDHRSPESPWPCSKSPPRGPRCRREASGSRDQKSGQVPGTNSGQRDRVADAKVLNKAGESIVSFHLSQLRDGW